MSGIEAREIRRAKRGSTVAAIINAHPEKDGRGRPKAMRETKRSYTLMFLPSLYEDVKKIAYMERRTVSDVVGACLTQYVQDHQDKLQEFDKG